MYYIIYKCCVYLRCQILSVLQKPLRSLVESW